MATIVTKPSGILALDVRVPDEDGKLKRKRVSCNTRDRAEAEQQRIQWLAGTHPEHPATVSVKVAEERARAPKASSSRKAAKTGLTVHAWLEQCLNTIWRKPRGPDDTHGCKSWKSSQSNVRVLMRFIDEDVLLADVDTPYISGLIKRLREKGYAEGTVRRKVMALSAALTEAAKVTDDAPAILASRPAMPEMKKPKNKQDRIVSYVEEEALLDCIDKRMEAEPEGNWWEFKALVIIGLDLGFRLGEILSCGPGSIKEKRWLDPSTGQMMSAKFLGLARYETKSDEPRDVPVTDRVIALFPALNARAVKGRWFPWKQGSSTPWAKLNRLRGDMEERGFDISDVKLHTLRHTCATRLAEGGLDLVSLKDWLGHSDVKITEERYVHLMATHLYRGAIILNGGAAPRVPSSDVALELCGNREQDATGSNRDVTPPGLSHRAELTH